MQTVIVISNPSGMLATIIPIIKLTFEIISYPYIKLIMKKRTPDPTAIKQTRIMK
jgi:hypothetical protein